MALIENGAYLVSTVYEMVSERARTDRRMPSKILMSQRQFDIFDDWFWATMGLHYSVEDQWCQIFLGAPIVICPDCDLYVPPAAWS